MIIESNSEKGARTKVFDAHGMEITLLVKSYNTATQVMTIYIPGEDSHVARTPKKPLVDGGNGWTCDIITADVFVPGSYAEINGQRVA